MRPPRDQASDVGNIQSIVRTMIVLSDACIFYLFHPTFAVEAGRFVLWANATGNNNGFDTWKQFSAYLTARRPKFE